MSNEVKDLRAEVSTTEPVSPILPRIILHHLLHPPHTLHPVIQSSQCSRTGIFRGAGKGATQGSNILGVLVLLFSRKCMKALLLIQLANFDLSCLGANKLFSWYSHWSVTMFDNSENDGIMWNHLLVLGKLGDGRNKRSTVYWLPFES